MHQPQITIIHAFNEGATFPEFLASAYRTALEEAGIGVRVLQAGDIYAPFDAGAAPFTAAAEADLSIRERAVVALFVSWDPTAAQPTNIAGRMKQFFKIPVNNGAAYGHKKVRLTTIIEDAAAEAALKKDRNAYRLPVIKEDLVRFRFGELAAATLGTLHGDYHAGAFAQKCRSKMLHFAMLDAAYAQVV